MREPVNNLSDLQEFRWTDSRLRPIAYGLETKPNDRDSQTKERFVFELPQNDRELKDFIENAVVAMHWVAEDGTISVGIQ